MGLCGRIIFVLSAVVIAFVFQNYRKYTKPLPPPEVDTQKYWGPGKAVKDDTSIVPFTISFKDDEYKKLISKLSDTSGLVPALEDARFHYGFNSKKLAEVIKYWKNDYLAKWYTDREVYLNKYPQFKTQIQGLNIHFIHVVPKAKPGTKVIPILLLHGWPGSVREFYDVIQILQDESPKRDFVFEIIVPGLPGYGFSDPAAKQGLDAIEIGVIFRNLMLRLGKTKFYVQGGDWGSMIGEAMATIFPENVIGYHSNMCGVMTPIGLFKNFIAETFPSYFVAPEHQSFFFPGSTAFFELFKEMGYMHLQSTKPDTIGTALSHNPIGLAAYILEKFSTWTNNEFRDLEDGGLEKYFTLDALLDNLMFYYIPNAITSSQRLYKETMGNGRGFSLSRSPTEVPVACARFKNELMHTIDWVVQDKYTNLIQTNYFQNGGHFAAFQFPSQLAQDVVDFIKKVEK